MVATAKMFVVMLQMLVVVSGASDDPNCDTAECKAKADSDSQVLLQSQVTVASLQEARTIETVDDIDMVALGFLPEHLDKDNAKILEGVPIFNYGHTYDGGMNPSLMELAEAKEWIVEFADSAKDDQLNKFCQKAKACEGNGACQSEGHPTEGGLSEVVLRGTEAELKCALKDFQPKPAFVESNQPVSIIPEIGGHEGETLEELRVKLGLTEEESQGVTWGLDRIDDFKGLDGKYSLPAGSTKGAGAHVYVADTGIRTSHTEFEGRAVAAFDVYSSPKECASDSTTCANDKHGHGTHCAGTVGGKSYGVAPKVALYAVKVLSDKGSGSFSGILQSLDHLIQKGQKPAVWSASLGSKGKILSMEAAFKKALAAGIAVTVAAGNAKMDACGYSPAYAPTAITVGASERPKSPSWVDNMAGFSNYGSCVDIFAPGRSITSAGKSSNTALATMSGTSMACPHVAGAAAVFMADGHTDAGGLSDYIKKVASVDRISFPSGKDSPNLMLYVGAPTTPTTAPTLPPTAAPTLPPTAAPTELPPTELPPTTAPTEAPTTAPTPAPKPAPKPAPSPAPKPAPSPAPKPGKCGDCYKLIKGLEKDVGAGLSKVGSRLHSLKCVTESKLAALELKVDKIKKLMAGVVPKVDYYQMKKGSCCCPPEERIKSRGECLKAHVALGLKHSKLWTGSNGGIQGGCSTRQFKYGGNHDEHFNSLEPGKARSDLTPICKKASSTKPAPPTTPPAPPTTPPSPVLPMDKWDLSGAVNFELSVMAKTTKASATLVAKAFKDGLWKNGGGAQEKLLFLRGGKLSFDIGWVGVIACHGNAVNDGKWHENKVTFSSGKYHLFIDGKECASGLRTIPDHADTTIVTKIACGHRVSGGKANGDMSQAFEGELKDLKYKK